MRRLPASPPRSPVLIGLLGLIVGISIGTVITNEPKADYTHTLPQVDSHIAVCFTPNKRCESLILDEISTAKKRILVQAYSFTDQYIAEALMAASMRGVDVRVLLDKSNIKDGRSQKGSLIAQGIPLRFDSPQGIAHNKIMIIDDHKIITGSYNFSKAAYTRNTENLLVISNPKLALEYKENWEKRWNLSRDNNP